MPVNKDVRKLLKRAEKAGFTVEHRGKHIVATPPNGAEPVVVASSSLSSDRALIAVRVDFKRAGLAL